MSLEFFPQYATFFVEIPMYVLFPHSKTKSVRLHNLLISSSPLNQFIMRKYGVQSTKVICWNRFSFLFSIYDINIFNMRLNIFEYIEFVVIGKEFRFMSIWEYISLDTLETALEKGFVEQFLEAIMNREPTGFLCNLGIQYFIGKLLFLLPLDNLRRILSYLG